LECDRVALFDIKTGNWSDIQPAGSQHSLVLMYRVDPYLSDKQWRELFRRMAACKVGQILFVPAQVLNLPYIGMLLFRFARTKINREALTFNGYIRSDKAFRSLWRDVYLCEEINLGNRRAYWLTI
jgi:hypothetical protein